MSHENPKPKLPADSLVLADGMNAVVWAGGEGLAVDLVSELARSADPTDLAAKVVELLTEDTADAHYFDACSGQINHGVSRLLRGMAGVDVGSYVVEPEYAETRKNFAVAFIEQLKTLPPAVHEDPGFRSRLHEALFASSNTMFEYIGGMADDFEILGRLQELPALVDMYRTALGDLTYKLAFVHDTGEFGKMLAGSVADLAVGEQMRVLMAARNLSAYADQEIYSTEKVQEILHIAAMNLENLPALSALLATTLANVTQQRLPGYAEAVAGVDPSNDEIYKMLIDSGEYDEQTAHAQAYEAGGYDEGYDSAGEPQDDALEMAEAMWAREQELAKSVSFRDKNLKPTMLAKGLYGARDPWGSVVAVAELSRSTSADLESTSLAEFCRVSGMHVSAVELELFSLMHRPEVRANIELALGNLDLADVSMAAQLKLLKYMSEKSPEEFYRLTDAVDHFRGDKLQLLEAFLVLGHGDDFGGVILDLVGKASSEASIKIFGALRHMRDVARTEGLTYGDPELAPQVERAMNERMTELMYAARDILENGPIVCEDFGRSVRVESVDELVDKYVSVLGDALERSHMLMQAGRASRVTVENGLYDLVRFSSLDNDDDMLLYVQAEGARSQNTQIQYGNSSGTEASISKIINPAGGHISSHRRERTNELSIRIDREGRTPGASRAAQADRNPMSEVGTACLDIGSVLGSPGSFGTQIALIISHGNKLRATQVGREAALNHNDSTFDQEKYGTATGFAELAQSVLRMARVRIAASKGGKLATLRSGRPDLSLAA